VSSSGRKAGNQRNTRQEPDRPARATHSEKPAPPRRVLFSRSTPLRSVSDVDPFMRVKRPYN